jgi:hypothetical protein
MVVGLDILTGFGMALFSCATANAVCKKTFLNRVGSAATAKTPTRQQQQQQLARARALKKHTHCTGGVYLYQLARSSDELTFNKLLLMGRVVRRPPGRAALAHTGQLEFFLERGVGARGETKAPQPRHM